ncbi:MAG: pseudouridine synthase, partial [Planctomycetota bacterium]|nr:pseudouridine synthase [Planctomycetota bacterium]
MNDPILQPKPDRQSLPTIVHEEPEWFVVNKPIGWHSVATRVTDGAQTIEQWLGESFPALSALPECGLVHRLDLSTSGCLLVARTAQMHQTLRDNFTAGFG